MSEKTLRSQRREAVRKAWEIEYVNVSGGGSGVSRNWGPHEVQQLLTKGKVSGYHGHHMYSVKGFPELAGNPYNIQFLTPGQHLRAHGGRWSNVTYGRYLGD